VRNFRLAVIGFGTVGQGVTQLLRDDADRLAAELGFTATIVAVSDPLRGSLYDPGGLDPGSLLHAVASTGTIDDVPAPHRGWDAYRTIDEADADVVVELSYTDLVTGDPATSHIRRALSAGRHVVTTNKGPIALHYAELAELATDHGVTLGIEGCVMSGTPTLRLGREFLAVAGVERIEGILNGTTNFILSEMEAGADYAAALATAQARGYAEADPTGDVEGHDAAAKLVILANHLFAGGLRLGDVERRGITTLGPDAIAGARSAGQRWKLVGRLERRDGVLAASVRPERLPLDHPLSGVMGVANAVVFGTRLLGDVTLVGPGAGKLETACAVIEDLAVIGRAGIGRVAPRDALAVA
jgi:homoserine dehydrogenase